MKSIDYLIILCLLFLCNILQAQTLEEAKTLYSEGKYAAAKPVLEKYVASSPGNASYNQWYGVCLYETGEYEKSEKYLKMANTKGIEGSYIYLGNVYKRLYKFDELTDLYTKYIKLLEKKKEISRIDSVKILLEQTERASKMLSKTENIQIIDSIIVDKNNFLPFLNLNKESGSVTPGNDSFSSIYTNQKGDKRYYSRKNGAAYHLFIQSKLMDGWNDEMKLPEPVNSSFNSNYPFVLSDGITMYYASQNNTIGGYDLFITRYISNNNSYLSPEQMGMPFNSVYNDYLLAIDELNGVGYFVSDRFQPENKVIIYTFIPNSEKILLETEDRAIWRNRARITSIKDTWKPGADYAGLLNKIRNQQKYNQDENKKDFIFVINDNIIYYNRKDFESDTASDLYVKCQSLMNEIKSREKELEKKRVDYANAPSSKKEMMKQGILEEETKLENLYPELEEMLIKSRNTEIRTIRQNQQ